MPLSPIDVQQQTFKVALRGYAEDEVDEFLDEVVISLRDFEQRLRDAQERVAVLEEQLSANRETEDAMRRTFLVAQRTADAILEEAKAESERLLSETRGEVDRVAGEQTEEKAKLLAETAMLRDRVHGLRASLSDLAAGTMRRLDVLDVDAVADRIAAVADREVVESPPAVDSTFPESVDRYSASEDRFSESEESIDTARHAGDQIDLDVLADQGLAAVDDAVLGEVDEEAEVGSENAFDGQAAGDDDGEPGESFMGFEDEDSEDEPDDDAEIARVPEWMTRDGSETTESRPPYRRPWERDEG